ncbi:PAS domain S-box protein [Geitlerinema sp. P-1104]|uniref:PAS domain-containing hybrid sensor histidine kinase/response regulator n=1 Tax=Geitlerinema sp. P-1104 TaxID=2546230 RepID=UPI001477463B|nr:PAS domain S-box protein [Geitlerinema sp. P-1104]NMG57430.1 PAS domain S-box protein [Geitlerinema sp. P-1104]
MSLERENEQLRRRVAELEQELQERRRFEAQMGSMTQDFTSSVFSDSLEAQLNPEDRHFCLDSQLFRAYVEAANDMVYAVDLQGQLTFINSYGERLLGCPPQGWRGKTYLDFVAPLYREVTAQAFQRLLTYGELKDFEFQVQNSYGTCLDLEVNGRLLYRQGVLVGGLGIARDITERKQVQRQLQMFMKAVDSAYDSTTIVAPNGTIIYVNPATARMFGYERERLIGQRSTLFYPEDAVISMEWLLEQVLAHEQLGWSGEVTCQRATGECFPALISVGVMLRDDGLTTADRAHLSPVNVDRILLTCRDITEQKQNQAKLAATNLELERASRLKSVFLANMSHELRTPLTSILGFSNLLLQEMFGDINSKQRLYLERVHESGEHLLKLISDVLDLSKVEAGKIELMRHSLAASQICSEAIALMSEQARLKQISLTLEVDPPEIQIMADELRLRQMLLNLLSNAIKFSDSRTQVQLKIEQDSTYVYLRVCDQGIGIPEPQQALLFQPFQQLDSSLARHHEGTGLGLALTRKLAELHGGTVTCHSTPGAGSQFTIILPREAQLPNAPMEDVQQSPTLAKGSQVGSCSLLLVEDHQHNALLLTDILQFWGYRVTHVKDAYEALAWLQEHRPDAILVDIHLPELDGLQLTQEVRRTFAEPRIPIIAITALAMAGDRQRCLEAGCDDYLTKPVSCDRLAELLKKYLQGDSEPSQTVDGP